jgi:hypothetical protein
MDRTGPPHMGCDADKYKQKRARRANRLDSWVTGKTTHTPLEAARDFFVPTSGLTLFSDQLIATHMK